MTNEKRRDMLKVFKYWLPELELSARYNANSIEYDRYSAINTAIEALEQEPKAGHWIKISPAGIYECSECHQNVMTNDIAAYGYCHGCGCRMKGRASK